MCKNIAVIGIGAIFPDALDVSEYWSNILRGKDSIHEIDDRYWLKTDYYNADPDAKDKAYSYRAGTVDNVEFDSMEYGISPKDMESTSVEQLFALVVARQALVDANIVGKNAKRFNRKKAGVILAASIGRTAFSLSNRLQAPKIERILRNSGVSEELSKRIIQRICNAESEWTPLSNPGYLANVTAGRIANRFDLYGTNFTVDAACASSLAAIKCAVAELESEDSDIVLTGGVNLDCSEFSFVSFCKTPAISRTGEIKPFDKSSDGMLLGDGVGMMVLKRLEDAERDNDKIYGIIKSIGSSGDGKGKSIFAPRMEGQLLALERAYEKSGIEPSTVSLIEAHGTGTHAGDECELEALNCFFDRYNLPVHSIGIGSVKSQIGHTRIAAGVASIIKVLMAMHHKILPGTLHVKEPSELLSNSPMQIITKSKPWIVNNKNLIRRAGVSAFGFGGTNFHVVLEEYKGEQSKSYRLHRVASSVIISGKSKEDIINQCNNLREKLSMDANAYMEREYIDGYSGGEEKRLGFVAISQDDAMEKLSKSIELLEEKCDDNWEEGEICFYSRNTFEVNEIVTLFSGQGGQYVDMFDEVAMNYPEMREMISLVDNAMLEDRKETISDLMYPLCITNQERQEVEQKLKQTQNTQPALACVCGGVYEVLKKRGYKSNYFIGHSFGELSCLWATGAFSNETFAKLAVKRGKYMGEPMEEEVGMLAVMDTKKLVERYIESYDKIYLANMNCMNQNVISGNQRQLEKLEQQLEKQNIKTKFLKVSSAFHSPYMRKPMLKFKQEIEKVEFNDITSHIYSNSDINLYPKKASEIKALLERQIDSPVHFEECVERAYKQGGRVFVEIGPGRILSELVRKILAGKDFEIISVNPNRSRNSYVQLEYAIMKLKLLGQNMSKDNYQLSLDEQIKNKKTKTSYSVEPIHFRTEKKKRLVEEAYNRVDEPVEQKVNNLDIEEEKNESKNDFGRNIMKGNQCDELMNNNNIIIKRQQINQEALKQFYNSQKDQLSIVNDFLNQEGKTENVQRDMIQLIKEFQHGSLDAFKMYANEQKHISIGEKPSEIILDSGDKKRIETEADKVEVQPAKEFVEQETEESKAKADDNTQEEVIVEDKEEIQILNILVDIISEVTGYPTEIIDKKMNMEADLGIDSIKKIEIFSKLGKNYSGSFQGEEMEDLTNCNTIEDVVNVLTNTIVSTDVNEVKPSSNADMKELVESESEEKLIDIIVGFVSELTGYPEDIIHSDMNLEIDLGIDSIKRAELFAKLMEQKKFELNQEVSEELINCNTIEQVAHCICSSLGNSGTGVTSKKVKRFEVTRKELPIGTEKNAHSGKVLLVTYGENICSNIAELLLNQGLIPIIITMKENIKFAKFKTYVVDFLNRKDFEKQIVDVSKEEQGNIAGLIYFAPQPQRKINLMNSLNEDNCNEIKNAFMLAKYFSQYIIPNQGEKELFFMSVVRMDGRLGTTGECSNVLQGGLSGLVKTAKREWNGVTTRFLDIQAECEDAVAAQYVLDEMNSIDQSTVEVGRTNNGNRFTLDLAENYDENRAIHRPTKEDVFLVTGGGKGVTASCIEEFASKYHSKFIILGRTELKDDLDWIGGAETKDEIQKLTLARLGEKGKSIKPNELKNLVNSYFNQVSIKRTMSKIKANDSEVIYYSCDITNPEKLREVVSEGEEKLGGITGLIHGAGVLADKTIDKKIETDFTRVVYTKVVGLKNCLGAVNRNQLKYVVLFSSIASFFGNKGQADYALGNEVLNKISYYINRNYKGCKCMAINWGPWEGGMVDSHLSKFFEEQNIQLISIEDGIRYFMEQFEYEHKDKVSQIVINSKKDF